MVLPKPFHEQVILELEAPANNQIIIYVYDALGQVVDLAAVNAPDDLSQPYIINWPSNSFPRAYFYSIIYWDEVQYTGRFMKY